MRLGTSAATPSGSPHRGPSVTIEQHVYPGRAQLHLRPSVAERREKIVAVKGRYRDDRIKFGGCAHGATVVARRSYQKKSLTPSGGADGFDC